MYILFMYDFMIWYFCFKDSLANGLSDVHMKAQNFAL